MGDEQGMGLKLLLWWRAADGNFPDLKLNKWAPYTAEIFLQTGNEYTIDSKRVDLLGYGKFCGTFWACIKDVICY